MCENRLLATLAPDQAVNGACELRFPQMAMGGGPLWTDGVDNATARFLRGGSTHRRHLAQRLFLVHLDLYIPLSARFCLCSCKSGRIGIAVGLSN